MQRDLQRKAKKLAPVELPPLSEAGFRPVLGEPVGQKSDWGRPWGKGRIHVHVFADGRRVAHFDRHDPGRGLGASIVHLASETKAGRAVIAVGAVLAALKAIGRAI